MAGRSLKLTSKTVDRIDAANSFALKPAPDAKVTGVGDGAKYQWTETFTVLDSTKTVDKDNPDRDVVQVQFRVPADQADSANAGRNYPQWYRFNVAALEAGEGADDYTMTVISAGKLRSLAQAAGFEFNEGDDLFAIFEPQGPGEQAPIVGAVVTALIVDKPGKDKDGAAIRRQEPVKFYPVV